MKKENKENIIYKLFGFVNMGIIGAVVYFVISVFSLFTTWDIKNFLYATGAVILSALIGFFVLLKWEIRRQIIKKYFLFFFSGFFLMISLMGMVAGIYLICHNQPGVLLLVLSVLGMGIVIFFTWLIHLKMKNASIRKAYLLSKAEDASVSSPASIPLYATGSFICCRKCGNIILSDSPCCPHCGKIVNRAEARKRTVDINPDFKTDKSAASRTFRHVTTAICFAALAVFLIFFVKMAPGFPSEYRTYGDSQIFTYFIGAGIAVGLIILYMKLSASKKSVGFYSAALTLSVLVIVTCSGLRIVYEAKSDAVYHDFPSSGTVCLQLNLDEALYSQFDEVSIRETSSSVTVGKRWLENRDTVYVKLNEPYSIKIRYQYVTMGYYLQGIYVPGGNRRNSYENSGYTDDIISFSQQDFSNNSTVLKRRVYLEKNDYADITMTFTRVCYFWDVIFY